MKNDSGIALYSTSIPLGVSGRFLWERPAK